MVLGERRMGGRFWRRWAQGTGGGRRVLRCGERPSLKRAGRAGE